MNTYVELMADAVEYIEENISGQLGLQYISKTFHLSEFHFDRLFKVVVGKSLKQYILGRKLTLSLERLKKSDESVINIALDLGFEYPEVFSRAFKKYFGVSPKAYRSGNINVEVVEKASPIPRNFITYNGSVALKASYIYMEALALEGLSVDVDVNAPDFKAVMVSASDRVLKETGSMGHLKQDKFYSLVSCHGGDSDMYTVFSGKEAAAKDPESRLEQRIIPGGWYASFVYEGDMYEIRSTFDDDLYRWIAVKGIELSSNGIGMVAVFDDDYIKNKVVRIWIPVKKPKT